MENNDQPTIDKLNHLFDIAEDGIYGYENAAKDITDDKFRALFHNYSAERKEYARILQAQILNLGGPVNTDKGGPIGAMHRTWMDFKTLVTGGDRDPILKACITGEEAAIRAYKSVLDEDYIIGASMQIVASQLIGIENALSVLKSHLADESV